MSQPGKDAYAVEASDLSVFLGGRKVLEIPSFRVKPNEVLVVIGPNGSGKSTLLLALALLLKPAAGTIAYNSKPVVSSKEALQLRRRLALVFQEPLLLNSTVWNNVTLGLRLRGVGKDETAKRTHKWLQRFGIAGLAKRQARTLSGGEAKRVSLARAFVLQPEVLFLDEPFNALDSPTRQALLEDFEGVLRETKVTTVMVTHDRDEAIRLADRVAVLINGSLRQTGTPEEVFGLPVDEELARFVEAGNIFHGVLREQNNGLAVIDIGGRQIQAVSSIPAGHNVALFLHHDDITLSLPSTQAPLSSARNQLRCRIVKIFPFASQMKVMMDCGFTLASVITRRSCEDLGLEDGKEVVASFKASAVHLFAHSGQDDGSHQFTGNHEDAG
jgi:tungstate transport system ATP-binding protein